MDVMGRLGRGPQRQLAVRRPHGDGGMLLHRQVCTALEEEQVLPDQVGLADPRSGVAEFEVDQLVEIAAVAVIVDPRLGMRDRCLRGVERLERLVHDLNEVEGSGGRLLRRRRHSRDGVADETDLVEAERVLVLGHGQNAERNRQILTREHRLDASELFSGRDVDRHDLCVWVRAAQQLAVQRARKREVIRKARRPGHLRDRVDFSHRFPDDPMPGHGPPSACARPRARRLRRS